ncbi:MAG: polysaccharide pyruvyl transferase CsaB [Candidatus Eremiobacteraeota bacterium]|nr:polysaccharide pyruvyl transferase CsaB [Candidatus Eremiobacteraeota bacterium]
MLQRSRNPRFLLSGYYGFGNLGDEALLAVIVGELKKRYPGARIDVLSADPASTAHQFGIEATPRAQIAEVQRAISRADVVLSGGGGLLQNATSLRSLLYYAGILRTAIRAGRKTMIFGQSIGPLDFWGKRIVRKWCHGTSRATVRDGRSYALLKPLLATTPIEKTADPVFLYDAPADDSDLSLQGLGPDSDPLVVVSVRKAPNVTEAMQLIASCVDRLSERHGARVGFLPLGGATDAEISTSIIRKCRTRPTLLPSCDLGRAANIIKRARVLIGMRLHSLILAVHYGVPFLAVPYDPKVAALCEDLAYPLPPLWAPGERTALAAVEVDGLTDRLWLEREALSKRLLGAASALHGLAARNFAVLDELVRE